MQKMFCLTAALLFAFAAMNVVNAAEAVPVTPAGCPCAKAACPCGPTCQCGPVCMCGQAGCCQAACCPPFGYRLGLFRAIRPVVYAPVCRPVYYAPRFYRVPYCPAPAFCW